MNVDERTVIQILANLCEKPHITFEEQVAIGCAIDWIKQLRMIKQCEKED